MFSNRQIYKIFIIWLEPAPVRISPLMQTLNLYISELIFESLLPLAVAHNYGMVVLGKAEDIYTLLCNVVLFTPIKT